MGNSLGSRQPTSTNKSGQVSQTQLRHIDAQSVKTQYASEARGIDGGKKVKGHKRHIIVDILGHLLHVQVHAANTSDTIAAAYVFERTTEKYPTIEAYSGDAGY